MPESQAAPHRIEERPAVTLRFRIDAYSPATMPLARLARYLHNLGTVLGESDGVHLVGVEDENTVPLLAVDPEAYPKLRTQVEAAIHGRGSARALKARKAIETDLAEDNADYAELVDEDGARLLHFTGDTTDNDEPEYGPFRQSGTLDGVPIVIGGKGDPVPVHLQDLDRVHVCRASRDLAKRIGKHLFATPLRVSGVGQWFRDRRGAWTMTNFRIDGYTELRSESLTATTARLQAMDAAWKHRADPLGDLAALRKEAG